MLEEMLTYDDVHLGVELTRYEKDAALHKVSALCATSEVDEDALYAAFAAREAEYSTGCGGGICIPHAKITGLTHPKVAIVRFAEGIDWEAIDGEPITLAVCLVMPMETAGSLHLKVVAALSRKLMKRAFVKRILAEEDARTLHDYVIENVEV